MIHLYGQHCVVCGVEIQPADPYCAIDGDKQPVFVHKRCCDVCNKAGDQ